MFGFSRRRIKFGRSKDHLEDPSQESRSSMRSTKHISQSNDFLKEENVVTALASGRSEDFNYLCSPDASGLNRSIVGSFENWMTLSTSGDKPTPRFNHAAAVVGNKMVVVGGESGHGMLDDTMILNLDKLTWSAAAPKVYLSAAGLPLKIPSCKCHCLELSTGTKEWTLAQAQTSLILHNPRSLKVKVVGKRIEESNGVFEPPVYLRGEWQIRTRIEDSGSRLRIEYVRVSWGKRVLLIGGENDPSNDRISMWSFDVETECWSNVEAKGDIPAARSGHTVIRAGSVLILFGGEDAKRRKLNDLHMFDLKSLTWLPLHYTGTGPSPRSDHVAVLCNDRILLIFGGQAKSKILNDLYSLDFETMVWTKIKTKGHHPSPRAGCSGAFYGTKWYIIGGGSKKKGHRETLIFDVSKYEWSISATSLNASVATSKGFSLVSMHHKDKMFLVGFGGNKKEPSNQIEILVMVKNEYSSSWRSAPDANTLPYDDLTDHLDDPYVSGRKSLSDSPSDPNLLYRNSSLRKQFRYEEDRNLVLKSQKPAGSGRHEERDELSIPNNSSSQRINKQETTIHMDIAGILASVKENFLTENPESSYLSQKQEADSVVPLQTLPSNIHQLHEAKISDLAQKNSMLERQLTTALANQEEAEKNLSSVVKSKQDTERKLNDMMREVEHLKEKLTSAELAHEESNSLSNIVHSDNVRLEHDVAFLKAVLDDTQKELHSTRGVLAGERSRAFQLQVEVFHLKQRLHILENRVSTPRKPYQM